MFRLEQVQWECKEPNNKFQPYPAEINTKLEKAQQKGDQIVEWIEEEATGNIIQWKIDLKSMKETDGKNTKDVQRRVIAEKGILGNRFNYLGAFHSFGRCNPLVIICQINE